VCDIVGSVIATPLPFRGPPPDRGSWVLEQRFVFDRQAWLSALPDSSCWPLELDTCAPKGHRFLLDRATVFAVAQRADSKAGALQTLVAAAIWGTGHSALGRVRRLRIFEATLATIGERVHEARSAVLSNGPTAGYRYLHASSPIKHLGPSFGTKVLYFAGFDHAPTSLQPLILDQFVVIALNRLCGLDWDPQARWTPDQYGRYLDLAHRWAEEWQTAPDVIERVLFSIGKSSALAIGVLSGSPLAG
jgi:8-oxoguanine DNA glycosylase-like protein